ncbi:MAG: AI-2E family transporter, partial [Rhodothermales bacterium]
MDRSQRRFLLVLVLLISILFVWMVRSFLITLFLAAVFAAMAMPMHRLIRRKVRGKDSLAATFSLLILIVAVGIPLFGFAGLVANQAVEISSSARPWIENQIIELDSWDELLQQFPVLGHIFPDEGELLAKLSEFTAAAGRFLADSVVEVTRGTAAFSLQVFVLLYAMFFFLKDGPRILERAFYYIPLPDALEEELVDRIVSVASVVLK